MLHVYLCNLQIAHGVKQCICQCTILRDTTDHGRYFLWLELLFSQKYSMLPCTLVSTNQVSNDNWHEKKHDHIAQILCAIFTKIFTCSGMSSIVTYVGLNEHISWMYTVQTFDSPKNKHNNLFIAQVCGLSPQTEELEQKKKQWQNWSFLQLPDILLKPARKKSLRSCWIAVLK